MIKRLTEWWLWGRKFEHIFLKIIELSNVMKFRMQKLDVGADWLSRNEFNGNWDIG